jgi:hypothetical protein
MRVLWLLGVLLVCGSMPCQVCAEDWYERPGKHLVIVLDSAKHVFDGTIARESDTILCDLEIEVVWPRVTAGPSQAVADFLNSFFLRFANSRFELAPGSTLQERVDAEFDSIVSDRWSERSLWGGAQWILEVNFFDHRILSVKITRNVCVSCTSYAIKEYFYHFALPDLTEISPDRLFVADAQPYLDSICAIAFRRDQKIPGDTSIWQAGYNLWAGLSSNFSITDSGIVYVYNAYEIASGAYGMSKAYLSWGQLKPVIRPDGPLGWVLKEE